MITKSQLMATPSSKKQGGFDCELIKRPPEDFQYECPVCLLVIREPHQVTCCGYAFCQACIQRVQLQKSGCPTCNKDEFSVFPDKRLQRSLYAYHVHCSHKKEGCQWTGELGELDKHLNENPKPDEQLSGCKFAEVECQHCTHPIQRRYINAHQIEECPQRPFACNYCSDYESTYKDVVTNHWLKCPFHPVPCPNKCGENLKRQNLQHHVNKDCPLTVVNCDFHYAGCEVQLPRKDMPAHLAENLVAHTTKLVTSMQEKIQEKDEQIAALTLALRNALVEKELEIAQLKLKQELEIAQLKAKQEEDHSSLQTLQLYTGPPVDLIMPEFLKHKQDGDDWYSKPFYTHPYGYKVCLSVKASVGYSGRHANVTVSICLMRGEFDDHLKWPFQGTITLQMINQLNTTQHLTRTADFSRARISITSRVTTGEIAEDRFNFTSWTLSNTELAQLLKNDCLLFRVTRVSNIN